jgi:major type 1 subunit fimbrin (pilin)
MSSSVAFAADGQINFEGEIIANGCTIDAVPTVSLGTYTIAAWANMNESSPREFKINLSNCPKTGGTFIFQGSNDGKDDFVLPTTKELSLRILNANGDKLKPNEKDTSTYVLSTTASVSTVSFEAQYVKNGTTVSEGAANGTVNFVVEYE